MANATAQDSSRASYYVDDALYDRLLAIAADWQRTAPVPRGQRVDAATREDCEALLFAEARLADDLLLAEWLECYAAECIYWIPSGHSQTDPRHEVTLEIHDRRRLEDRVARIHTGFAYSMVPPIRTRRVLGNLELWYGTDGVIQARASFIIDALFKGRHRILSGWYGYVLAGSTDGWRIAVKQVNLIDADQPQENNSFFL